MKENQLLKYIKLSTEQKDEFIKRWNDAGGDAEIAIMLTKIRHLTTDDFTEAVFKEVYNAVKEER
jgi:hypothetical protein